MLKSSLMAFLAISGAAAACDRKRRSTGGSIEADILDYDDKDVERLDCVPDRIYCETQMRMFLDCIYPPELRKYYGKIACSSYSGIKSGNRAKRIVKGRRAELGQWPWMVQFATRSETGSFDFHCGGALLNSFNVVTAKHCVRHDEMDVVNPGDIRITAGCLRLTPKDPNAQEYDVESIIMHEKADIAILRLRTHVNFTKDVWPIWFRGDDESEATSQLWGPNHLGETEFGQAAITGWGSTREKAFCSNDLQWASIGLRHDKACMDAYSLTAVDPCKLPDPPGVKVQHVTPFDHHLEICAGGTACPAGEDCANRCTCEEEPDTCQGDSGGPLMYFTHNHWVLLGVTSRGRGCGRVGTPGIYTWTHHIQKWIEETVWPSG